MERIWNVEIRNRMEVAVAKIGKPKWPMGLIIFPSVGVRYLCAQSGPLRKCQILPDSFQILEYTPETHPDYGNLVEALNQAELKCSEVNESVREKENSDRLEWLQTHVQCEGVMEVSAIFFFSVTPINHRHHSFQFSSN